MHNGSRAAPETYVRAGLRGGLRLLEDARFAAGRRFHATKQQPHRPSHQTAANTSAGFGLPSVLRSG